MTSLLAIPRGQRIPRGGAPGLEGSLPPSGAASHPLLPFAPIIAQQLGSSQPGLPGSLDLPPQVVLDCAWTKRWAVTANLSIPGVTLAASGEIAVLSADLASRVGSVSTGAVFTASANESIGDIEASIGLTLNIGALTGYQAYGYQSGLWWPALSVLVQSIRDDPTIHPGDTLQSATTAGLSQDENVFTAIGALESVTVEISGQSVPLVQFDPPAYPGATPHSLTGTISLTATEWF